MSTVLFLIWISIAMGAAQEDYRNARIRFPIDNTKRDLRPQLYASESQSAPIIVASGSSEGGGHHYLFPKEPSPTNPFGEVNDRGFAEGVLVPTRKLKRDQDEFHQTVPPPQRSPLNTPQGFLGFRQEPPNQHHHTPTQQSPNNERHRFGTQRPLPYNELKKMYPNLHAQHEIYYSGMLTKKDKKNQPDVAMYHYSIVTHHDSPDPYNQDHFSMEISQGIPEFSEHETTKPKPNPITTFRPKNQQQQQTSQKPKPIIIDGYSFSPEEFDFSEGALQEQVKGNFFTSLTESNIHHAMIKQHGQKNPLSQFSTKQPQTKDEEFSFFDDFLDYPGPQENIKNIKKPSFHPGPKPEHKRCQEKPSHKPQQRIRNNDNMKKKVPFKFPSLENIKSNEFPGEEKFSDESFPSGFHYNLKPVKKQPQKQQQPKNHQQKHQQKRPLSYGPSFYFTQKPVRRPVKPQDNSEGTYEFDYSGRTTKKTHPQSTQTPIFNYGFTSPQKPKLKNQHKEETDSEENIDYDIDYSQHPPKQSEENQENVNYFGSDWIPINAPEGAVSAKSYEIPAPNLSRGSHEEKKSTQRRERPRYEVEDEEEDSPRFQSSDTVYGVQKRGHSGEEVVSATFRVKQ